MFTRIRVFRVKPGQELLGEITRYCLDHHISSGIVIGIIGSLENARLNFIRQLPGKYESADYAGPLEIVAAQGSIALKDQTPILHIHIQVSTMNTSVGGHLVTATVFSTAEVTIGELDFQLRRQADAHTGLNELVN